MKVLGILIIIIALFLAGHWTLSKNNHKLWAVMLCIIAIFVGCFFILQDRAIEISFKNVGKIKAAAQKATADADEIDQLRNRVESQSATVDLVAKSAKDAMGMAKNIEKKNEIIDKKVKKLDVTVSKANESLKKMENITEFSTILLAAQNDNWRALKKLESWANDNTFQMKGFAENAWVSISASCNAPITPGYMNINWKEGFDPLNMPIDQLRDALKLNSIYHADLVNIFNKREDFSRKEKMVFFIEVLEKSNSINAKGYAGSYFVKLSKDDSLKWNAFKTKPLFEWWNQHQETINE